MRRICTDCGAEFTSAHAERCKPCRKERKRLQNQRRELTRSRQPQIESHPCDDCGVPFDRTFMSRAHAARYCPACRTLRHARPYLRHMAAKVAAALRPLPPLLPRAQQVCEHCGMRYRATHGNSKFCSRKCYLDRWSAHHVQQRAAARSWTCGYCGECGQSFTVPGRGLDAYCCETCFKRAARRRDKKARDKRIQTAAKREVVRHGVVAERDGWRCHICKRKVTRSTWSIDHLVPLSDGGDHTYENVALAHQHCNSRRGARGAAQLRLVA